jgi:hypothetical protein
MRGMFVYESGSSKTTNGGFDEVYPDPGFVIVTPMM